MSTVRCHLCRPLLRRHGFTAEQAQTSAFPRRLLSSSAQGGSAESKTPLNEDQRDEGGLAGGVRMAKRLRAAIGPLEDRWEGSPLFKILASPLRRCAVTQHVLPKDLMLQLKPIRLPQQGPPDTLDNPAGASSAKKRGKREPSNQIFLPDQLLHPRFSPKKRGKGLWLTLHPSVLNDMEKTGAFKPLAPFARLPPNLVGFITGQLQQRILQEVELIHDRLTTRSRAVTTRALRQLAAGNDQSASKAALTVEKTDSVDDVCALLRRADTYGRPAYSGGLLCHGDVDGPSDATFYQPIPIATDAEALEEEKAPTVPLYDLSLFAPEQLSQVRKHLTTVNLYQTSCLSESGPDVLRGRADEVAGGTGSSFYALRQSSDTVNLLVALHRLRLWTSPTAA